MTAGVVFLVIFLVFCAVGLIGCWWHRRKIKLQQQQFIAWAGEQMEQHRGTRSRSNSHSELNSSVGISDEDSQGRSRRYSSASDLSYISVNFETEHDDDDVPDVKLSTWESKTYGISCQYPTTWRIHKKTPAAAAQTSQLLVEFVVRRHENVYMRLSITFDDCCWSKLTPRTFSRHMVAELPTAVPGSQVVRQGPVADSDCGAFEVSYTVPDEHETEELSILSYFFHGNTRMFTFSFTIETHSFHQYERFGRQLLNSLTVVPLKELLAANVQETFTDPSRTNWSHYQSMLTSNDATTNKTTMAVDLIHSNLVHPVHWKREFVENPRVVRFCCSRGEQCLKRINYFIVDMSSLGVSSDSELLSDLVMFYKQEIGSQGTNISKEMEVVANERKGGMNGPFFAFQTNSKKRFVKVKSHVLVGLHYNNGNVFGHIVTVSVSSDYFDAYQKFAQFVFKTFVKDNNVEGSGGGSGGDGGDVGVGKRERSPSGRLLSPRDFQSSSM